MRDRKNMRYGNLGINPMPADDSGSRFADLLMGEDCLSLAPAEPTHLSPSQEIALKINFFRAVPQHGSA